MRLATPADFYNGPIYTHYYHHHGYRKRAELLRHFPQPILIAGCGFGFLVVEFTQLGINSCGIDASPWAISQRVTNRVSLGSILQSLSQPWPTIVTEDLLPCLNDDEAQLAATNCRRASLNVLHLVTEHGQADLNYHSLHDWALLTQQPVISLEGM